MTLVLQLYAIYIFKSRIRAGESTQQLRALASLPETRTEFLATISQLSIAPIPGDLATFDL